MSAAARPNSPISSRLTLTPADYPTRAHFAPDPAHVPNVVVHLAPLATYECLIGTAEIGGAA